MLHWVSMGPNETHKRRSILSFPAHILNEGSLTGLLVCLFELFLSFEHIPQWASENEYFHKERQRKQSKSLAT